MNLWILINGTYCCRRRKEWRKHNKVIGQVKISYKKFYEKCELSLAGGKYREYQGLYFEISVRAVDRGDQGLVPFEDKPFRAYLNKRLSKRRKLDVPMVH